MSTGILAAPYSKSAETDAGNAFVEATLVCLVLIALPIKNAAYLVPPVFVAMQLLAGNLAFVGRTLLWAYLAICFSAVSIVIDSLSGQEINSPGLMFGLLTYATLAVIIGLRSDFAISASRRRLLTSAVSWFVLFQSAIGLMQFAASGDPDSICGTFGLLDFLGGVTIAQVYLTFNLFAIILFLLTDRRGALANSAIVVGLVTCILAHSGHQTLLLMASLAIVGILQMRLRDVVKLGTVLTVLIALTASISTIGPSDITEWYRKVAVDDNSPKRMVALSAAEIMSEPKNLLLGVGMGQFGSRAALISSGEYLKVQLPRAFVGESRYFRDGIQPAKYEFLEFGENSAMSAPYFSALNVFVEFGAPLTLLLLSAMVIEFLRNRRLSRSPDAHARAVYVLANVGIVFFVLCCFIENYVEFPQAVFLPALLYVVAKATVRTAE